MTTKMKAWQFSTATSGLEHNLHIPATGVPKPRLLTPTQLLIQVHTAALNPADYKVPELGLIARTMISLPGIPGMDFCGKVVEMGDKIDDFRIGEMVFGSKAPLGGKGSCAEFVVVERGLCVGLPEGVSFEEAAGVGVAGVTAYGTLVPNLRGEGTDGASGSGKKVFINGGSGGTGTFGIQIAKIMGAHVTVSCSGENAELCKSLGADEVLDYKTVDVEKELVAKGQIFDLAVDNIGHSSTLYRASNNFLKPGSKFIQVGADIGVGGAVQVVSNMFVPSFFGGGRNRFQTYMMKIEADPLREMGRWMKEGKLRTVVEKVYEFEELPKAFERLKTGRVKGKLVVRVKNA